MALKQQSVAKMLHQSFSATRTVACVDADVEQEGPWFEFSVNRWRELTEADLPLEVYTEEDVTSVEDNFKMYGVPYPRWYKWAKAQVVRKSKE